MNIIPSITETELFIALRAYVLTLVNVEVVRGQDNRVAMPVGEFVMLTPRGSAPMSTTITGYTASTQTLSRSNQFTVQIDCYGASAGDRAQVLSTVFRSSYAVDSLAQVCTPLYTSDIKQTPLVNGEQQYEERWTFDAVMQYNPVITLAQQSANALEITPSNVDVNFKP